MSMSRFAYNRVIALVFLSFVATGLNVRSDDGPDTLFVVRNRHRAAREAIRTYRADIAIHFAYPEKLWMSGKYWRAANIIRLQEYSPDTNNINDNVLRDGEIRGVGAIVQEKADMSDTGLDEDRPQRCSESATFGNLC